MAEGRNPQRTILTIALGLVRLIARGQPQSQSADKRRAGVFQQMSPFHGFLTKFSTGVIYPAASRAFQHIIGRPVH